MKKIDIYIKESSLINVDDGISGDFCMYRCKRVQTLIWQSLKEKNDKITQSINEIKKKRSS